MDASMLEETIQNPNPSPVVAELHYDDIWQLCLQARDLAWDPVHAIDWADLRRFAETLPQEVRDAGAEWWSLRAWMEHGATPYGAERYRDAVFEHLPFEVKQHVVNFIAEELRHHEASFRVAAALGEYQAVPRSDYFQMVIPKFHDEKDEKAMLGAKFAKKLRGSLLNGVYAVVNPPEDERKRSSRARHLAAEYGLGATFPDEEVNIIAEALEQIRKDVAPHEVPIPRIPEIEGAAPVQVRSAAE